MLQTSLRHATRYPPAPADPSPYWSVGGWQTNQWGRSWYGGYPLACCLKCRRLISITPKGTEMPHVSAPHVWCVKRKCDLRDPVLPPATGAPTTLHRNRMALLRYTFLPVRYRDAWRETVANVSDRGLDLIKNFEGLRLQAYRDSVGVWTIGYGHTGVAAKEGAWVTHEEAERLLTGDVGRFTQGVIDAVQVVLMQDQFDALVSFAFNVGINAFKRSSMLAYINRSDFAGAASEFEKWVFAGGNRLEGLARRRRIEAALFRGQQEVGAAVESAKFTSHEGQAEGEATEAPADATANP